MSTREASSPSGLRSGDSYICLFVYLFICSFVCVCVCVCVGLCYYGKSNGLFASGGLSNGSSSSAAAATARAEEEGSATAGTDTARDSPALPIRYIDYTSELQLPAVRTTPASCCSFRLAAQSHLINFPRPSPLPHKQIMELVDRDLSEPYSIFTYRYFLHSWPDLCICAMLEEEARMFTNNATVAHFLRLRPKAMPSLATWITNPSLPRR